MFKKPIFLYIATFVLAVSLAFLSGYFVVQEAKEARGKDIKMGANINMINGKKIYNVSSPLDDDDAVTLGYFNSFSERWLQEGSTWYRISSWCDVNDFSWCYQDVFPPYDLPEEEPITCFTADTPILMANGIHKPIKDVKPGDLILTRENESSDKMVSAKVAKTSERTVNSYRVINKELEVTDNHPIFVGGKINNWKQAWTIRLGNKLLSEKGQEVIVNSLEIKREKVEVYNLEIEGYNTYFSGGFYVHNKPEVPY